MNLATDETTLEITRVFDAPPVRVFDAWLNREEWQAWIGPKGEELDTVAIVTAAARRDLASLHPRVPVAIRPGDFDRWLDCSADEAETVMALLMPPHEGEFVWHEVSMRVNRVANDDAQLTLPITAEELAAEEDKPAKRVAPRRSAPAASDDGQGSLF